MSRNASLDDWQGKRGQPGGLLSPRMHSKDVPSTGGNMVQCACDEGCPMLDKSATLKLKKQEYLDLYDVHNRQNKQLPVPAATSALVEQTYTINRLPPHQTFALRDSPSHSVTGSPLRRAIFENGSTFVVGHPGLPAALMTSSKQSTYVCPSQMVVLSPDVLPSERQAQSGTPAAMSSGCINSTEDQNACHRMQAHFNDCEMPL